MKRKVWSLAFVVIVVSLLAPTCVADDASSLILKQNGFTLSLELKFSKKNQNPLERALSILDTGPNGYATGFIVGDGLVLTSYHVVSGNLTISKKAALGFGAKDQLEVKVYVNGCQATVLKVDAAADLALLRVCHLQDQANVPTLQPISPNKDAQLLLIARPHGGKIVRRGVVSGPYMFNGQEYLAAKLDVRDGFSGSPVYNDKAELVGVYSGYDWSKKVAVISSGTSVQKILQEYLSNAKP